MIKETNILIVGVGGQGTLLASRVLGNYAARIGADCKLSEVHGMAQRGGSVVTHVRMGQRVYSPIIGEGFADILVAFERLEALRYIDYLKDGGIILTNEMEIPPLSVLTGGAEYPQDIDGVIKNRRLKHIKVNAADIAEKLGNIRTVNTVMIGQLAKSLEFDLEKIEAAVLEEVPQKAAAINKEALYAGFDN